MCHQLSRILLRFILHLIAAYRATQARAVGWHAQIMLLDLRQSDRAEVNQALTGGADGCHWEREAQVSLHGRTLQLFND